MTIILGALLGLSIIALIVTVVLFKVFRRCNLETTGEMLFECDVTWLCSRACHYFFCGCSFFALWYRRGFLLGVFLQLPNCHYNGIVKKYFYDGDKTTKNEIEQNRVSRRNSLIHWKYCYCNVGFILYIESSPISPQVTNILSQNHVLLILLF